MSVVERREYAGAAVAAGLQAGIGTGSMTISVAPVVGWPTGSVGPFTVVIDRGTSSEEKVKIASRSGNNLTVATGGRGADGTAAQSHGINATVEHVLGAYDLDILNAHAADETRDDHSQYVHTDVARTIPAAHNFSGPVEFSDSPVFSGTPLFTNGIDVGALWGVAADLQLIKSSAPNEPALDKFARADHGHPLDITSVRNTIIPAGMLWMSVAAVVPTGWLECNGQTVTEAAYPALFAAIGTQYGVGGAGTFKLPDYRDVMLSGAGSARAVGATGGSDTKTIAVGNLPAHSHGITDPGHGHAINDPTHRHNADGDGGLRWIVTGGTQDWLSNANDPDKTQPVTITDIDPSATGISILSSATGITGTQNTGSGTALDIVPKWRAARVLIKAH